MKPSLPKGLRDFGPKEVNKRNYIFSVAKKIFSQHGFAFIETPTMESLSTLTGKYGEEGDQLLFKVLNNGDFLSRADEQALSTKNSKLVLPSISKRGLRYDLTVPFARFVVMNQNEISFPFKRAQIQPVWRADRPQKGRFQEFYQCDVDVVGSDSLLYEAELIQIYDEVFTALNLEAEILINNRKILDGLVECAALAAGKDQDFAREIFVDMVVALDKIDKVGEERVREEMELKGMPAVGVDFIIDSLKIHDISILSKRLDNSEIGKEGLREIQMVNTYLEGHSFGTTSLRFDLSLARGLSYYTGCVFEVKAKHVQMGSIGGGGRYDNLTAGFGLKDVSGVGVSFGIARIFLVMEELGLFPETTNQNLDLLILALDDESLQFAFKLAASIRKKGKLVDLYPEATKMKKMMKYANNIEAPFVLVIGENERINQDFKVKNMDTGEQLDYSTWLNA